MSSLALYVLSLLLVIAPPGKLPERETRDAGAARYEVAAQSIADAAHFHAALWPQGPVDLARVMVTQAYWSTGFQVEIQNCGKRGPAGEVSLADVQIRTLRAAVPWELARKPEAELVSYVCGTGYTETRRSFEVMAVLLGRARAHAARSCPAKRYPQPIEQSMFAIYATGHECVSTNFDWCPECKRMGTLGKMRARTFTAFPDWYVAPKAQEPAS